MPFYIHPKEREPQQIEGFVWDAATCRDKYIYADPSLPTIQEAAASPLFNKKLHKITFLCTHEERRRWREREANRMYDGTYIQVPWYSYSVYENHFPHLSLKSPGMIAYTPTDLDGMEDRQVTMRPGRYIQKYYIDKDNTYGFQPEQVERYIAECSAKHLRVFYARTADEIEEVYTAEGAPHSCMVYKAEKFDSPEHPVRVYGDSDLQLAYTKDSSGKITSRGLVWEDRKLYARLYGNTSLLKALLDSEGYKLGGDSDDEGKYTFVGAKVRAIPVTHNGRTRYVLPYVDWVGDVCSLSEDGKWIILGDDKGSTKFGCEQTDGWAENRGRNNRDCDCRDCRSRDDDEEDDIRSCEDCDSDYTYIEGESHGARCGSCEDNYFICSRCDDEYNSNDNGYVHYTNDGVVCVDCAARDEQSCRQCDEYYNENTFSYARQRTRRNNRTTMFCDNCDVNYHMCQEHDEPVANDDDCAMCVSDEQERVSDEQERERNKKGVLAAAAAEEAADTLTDIAF